MRLPERAYPPGAGHVVVPTCRGPLAPVVLDAYAPGRRSRVVLHRVARRVAAVAGTRWVAAHVEWRPPTSPDAFDELLARASRVVGAPTAVAAIGRVQATRAGCSLLLCDDSHAIGLLRLRTAPLSVDAEAMERAAGTARLRTVVVPRRLATGDVADGDVHWHWSLFEALDLGAHTPVTTDDVGDVLEDVAAVGRAAGVGTPGTPAMHGDLAPWNLRRTADGRLVLLDWEAAGVGPPLADLVHWRLRTSGLTGRPLRLPPGSRDAATFWDRRLAEVAHEDPEVPDVRRRLARAAAAAQAGRSTNT